MEKLVIGIDSSKETMNFCCLQGSADRVVLEGTVGNDREGCREMIRKLRALQKGLKVCDFLFCGENTGCYSLEKAKGYNPQSKGIQKLKAWFKAHDHLTGIKVSLQNRMTLRNIKRVFFPYCSPKLSNQMSTIRTKSYAYSILSF